MILAAAGLTRALLPLLPAPLAQSRRRRRRPRSARGCAAASCRRHGEDRRRRLAGPDGCEKGPQVLRPRFPVRDGVGVRKNLWPDVCRSHAVGRRVVYAAHESKDCSRGEGGAVGAGAARVPTALTALELFWRERPRVEERLRGERRRELRRASTAREAATRTSTKPIHEMAGCPSARCVASGAAGNLDMSTRSWASERPMSRWLRGRGG